jgi:hypothetical protein
MDISTLTASLTPGTKVAAGIAALLFAGIGARCLLAPAGGARFFGAPVTGADGLAFVQAMGARNIVLSLTAFGLILFDLRAGLAVLVAAAALMAALDAMIVRGAAGLAKAAKHIAYVPIFTAFALWIASGS